MSRFTPTIISVFKKGYTFKDFRGDAFAGLTVAIVALPLSMALGIASGASPEQGLITAIIAGFLIALLGGSRVQVGGPTGSFVVILHSVISQFGYDGLLIATILAGIILVIGGYARLGVLIKFIPHSVITGFTSAIAVIIASTQVKDFFWINLENVPPDFISKWGLYFRSISSIAYPTLIVGFLSCIVIFLFRRYIPKVPRYLVALILASLAVFFFNLDVATVGSQFPDFVAEIPSPRIPEITLSRIRQLMPSAFVIAFIAGVEALLSAVVADGLTGYKHKSDQELIGQGLSNCAVAFFGGIPATGALARTATNVTAGAKTPLSGMFHAVFLFIFIIFAGSLMKFVPMPSLAAILFFVAWEMSEVHQFVHTMSFPGGDRIILLLTFFLTVFVDLTVAIAVGVAIAALIFLARMSRSVKISPVYIKEFGKNRREDDHRKELPKGVEAFWIAGPIFFGMVSELPKLLKEIGDRPKVLIIRMRLVPFLDISGAMALDDLVKQCKAKNIDVIFSALQEKPKDIISKLHQKNGWERVFYAPTYDKAIVLAKSKL